MSYTYILACPACRTALPVGRLIESSRLGNSNWSFGGRRNPDDTWLAGEQLQQAMEHFIIAHRGHAVSVIPEDMVVSIAHSWHMIDFPDEALISPIDPEPDPQEDAARVTPALVDMLRKPPL